MAIIYTYPVKATPNDNDLILISDSEDSNNTKQVKISTLPGGSGSGVSSVTAVLPLASTGGSTPAISLTGLTGFGTTGQVIKVNSNADGLEWGTAGGGAAPQGNDNNVQLKSGTSFAGSDDLDFDSNVLSVKHTVDIKGQGNLLPAGRLKLYCENSSHGVTLEGPAHAGGNSYNLKFPSAVPTNNQILQYTTSGNLGWIATPSGGGGGAVDSVVTTNGTYINLTPTTASTAAVTVSADLSAVNGTSDTTTKFLSKDNTWDVPSYTTNTDTTYSAGTGLDLNGTAFSLESGAALTNLGGGSGSTYLKKDGTWATPSSTSATMGHCSVDWADGCTSLQTGSLIRFYRFTNSASFTPARGWIFVTNNSGGGSETPLIFRLGIYSGSSMGTINGLTLLGSGASANNPGTGLLSINLSAAQGQSLAMTSGNNYFLALMAQYATSSTAVAGKAISSDIYTIANTAGTLPTATSLPALAPAEGQSFGTNAISFACTLV